MINNYDSVVTCNSSGTTISQEQGETSFTQTKRTWLSFVMVFVALFSLTNSYSQNIFTDGFETGNTDQGTSVTNWTQETIAGTQIWVPNSTLTDYNRSPRTGSFNAYLRYGNTDWLFRSVELTGGVPYKLSVYARQDGTTTANAGITLKYGTVASAAGMTNSITANVGVGSSYTEVKGVFTPATTGTYYIGILGTINSTPWYLSIDDVSLNVAIAADAAPITFSATAITQNGMTLNWVDNSTNENAFRVYRSSDNVTFTQIGADVASTTSAGTGTAYSSVQTGLSAGTLYYYKIVAVTEAESAPLTGSETTLNGATYYWVGTSTSAAPAPFATVTNWNTSADGSGSAPTALANSDTYIVDGDGSTTTGGNVFISVAAATTVGQLKVINNTTLSLESATTATRTITISGGPGDDFVIESGSVLSLINATKAAAIAFSGAGNIGLIAGTLNFSGSTSNVVTTTGGTGTVVTVASTGVVNLGVAGNSLVGSVATLSFAAGSNCNSTGATTGAPPVPLATWDTTATLTISGLTTSTTAPTNNNQSFGNIVFNCPSLTTTLNFFGANSSTIKGNLTITAAGATGSTGIFRATSTGTLTVNGNLLISQGKFQAATTTGTVIANGNTTIDANGILDLSTTGAGGLSQRGTTLTNNGVLTGTSGTLSFVNFTGSAAQTLAGSGTVLTNIASLNMQNTAGLTISHTNPIIVARVNLFQGTITNSNKITFGTGAAVNCTTQIGSAGLTTPGGSFDAAPTFNLGTGTYTLLYQQESVARTSGFEIPATRTVNSVTVNNTNGVTLAGGNLTALTTLALTNGIVTTGANTLILGDAATVGTLTGGSDTAYVNGALTRSIANANTNATYIPFPIGKSGVYTPIAIAPATTSIALFKAESFGTNSGTEDPSIIGLSATRRFEALPVSGTFTEINVRLSDVGIVSTNIPVQAPTATGAYAAAFGSTAAFVAGPPITVTSSYSVTSANYTGYLSYANSNSCSGTPAPGNTIASTNAICLGQSVNLSIQTIPAGSGITYQWKSSTDGTTYTAITGATNPTLTVTPSVATYYVCDVTCATGPATGTSTAEQITFSNSVTASTPATRCGTGTVDLSATPSTGATIKWYAAATGGTPLATGNNFTTPSIAATTTYYAGAETSTAGTLTVGTGTTLTGTTSQNSLFCNYWYQGWRQIVYTAQELAQLGLSAGNITSITFNTTTLPSPATINNFAVRMGSTTNSTLATFQTTGLAVTYGPANYTPVIGSNTITLATPYAWDGVSNIIIDIREDGQYGSSNSATYASTTATNTVLHTYSSSNNAAFYTSAPSATASTLRPNIIFNGQVACSSGRMPVVATVTAPPALTLSSTAATICEASATSTVTLTSTVGDYNTYAWSPATGVTGDETLGWTFNPSVSTNYTLTATQTSGSLCVTTTTFAVTVNPRPSVMTIAPVTASICPDAIQSLAVSGGTLSSTVIVGTSSTTNTTTSYPSPFTNYYGGAKHQMLIKASELTALGLVANQPIVSLDFEVTGVGSTFTGTLNNFQVDLGLTTTNTLSTSFLPTSVNARAAANLSVAVGVVSIPLTGNFVWDGTSNIVVQTSYSNANSGTTTDFVQMKNSDPGFSSTNWYRADSVTSTAILAATTATSSGNARPNMVFKTTLPTTITWSPVTNLFTDAAATTAYVDGANASTVFFKSSTAAAATTYTATSTSGVGCVRTATVDVTVNPLPTVVTVAPAAVCAGTTVDLTAAAVTTGSDAGLTYTYFTNMEATTAVTTPAAVTTSGTYYIKGTNTNGCAAVTAVTVTVNPLPVVVVTNPATVCSPNTVDITATTVTTGSDTGLTFTYFTDMAATTALATPAAVTTSGTYYIKAENANGCVKITPVTVTVNVTAVPTAAATQTFCGAANLSQLAITGSGIKIYSAATAGTEYTASLWPLIGLVNGTTYYASQTLNGCESTERVAITAVINTIPSAPNAVAQAFCNTATVADLVPSGATYNWYDAATGGTALTTATALTATTYYVSQTANGCESTRTAVVVTLNTTLAPTATAQDFCGSALVANLSATGTNLKWYDVATNGSALAANVALATGTYYVSQTVNNCESTRTEVAVTVNNTAAPTASAQSFCSSATVADLVATGTSLNWYNVATGGTALTSSTALAAGIYYVSQTVSGCESTRTAVTVTITTPATPTGAATQNVFGAVATDATIEDINVSGTGIVWYNSEADATAGTNPIAAGTQLVSGNTYYAVSVVGTCRSTALAVTVTVTLGTEEFDIQALKYFPNPVVDVLTIRYSQNITAVQVFDIAGRSILANKENATEITVNFNDLPAAVYIIKVTTENASGEFKVVKK